MNTNETERPDTYDRACRDADDNCPTENAVLRREWRQQTARFELLRAAAAALLDDMGEPDDGVEANLMQALRDAMA